MQLCKLWIPGLLALASLPASAQLSISNEDLSIKFGFQGQIWADAQQDANASGAQGYQQNLYLRRIRLLTGGQLGHDLTFFVQIDQPNLGKTPKVLNSGFLVQDAFMEWKPARMFAIDGGLMIVPLARNTLQSTASYYTLDVSAITTVNNAATQSSGLRDLGFQARGFFLDDRLQYRIGIFQGQRDANAHNSLRKAGYVQYNFLGKETGYTFAGTSLGKQKILAIDAGVDRQASYHAWSANIAAAIPVLHGNEIGGQFQFIQYDGGVKFPTIARQNDALLEFACYVRALKLQPFAKLEAVRMSAVNDASKDYRRYGAGVNYYVHGQNLKVTGQIQHLIPENSPVRPSNQFTLQLQVFYF